MLSLLSQAVHGGFPPFGMHNDTVRGEVKEKLANLVMFDKAVNRDRLRDVSIVGACERAPFRIWDIPNS